MHQVRIKFLTQLAHGFPVKFLISNKSQYPYEKTTNHRDPFGVSFMRS